MNRLSLSSAYRLLACYVYGVILRKNASFVVTCWDHSDRPGEKTFMIETGGYMVYERLEVWRYLDDVMHQILTSFLEALLHSRWQLAVLVNTFSLY